jgi:DNA-3-methyladenine glycosylase II
VKEQALTRHEVTVEVLGPWSLDTSKRFWEGFAPAALLSQRDAHEMWTVFRVEGDWSRAEVRVAQRGNAARIVVTGDGDLDRAAAQTCRFLSLDVDARGWPDVALRDQVIADAQDRLPGLRPCGFHSPYEAAVWAVLSQRLRIVQAARLRDHLVRHHGQDGAFPAPDLLYTLDLDLPGRKTEYLHAVAEAALDGRLDGDALRALETEDAVRTVQQVKGLGPFAAELVVLRGANAPDAIPSNERRLDNEITHRYGPGHTLAEVSEAWRPFRTWAAVHLRTLREERTCEISGHSAI